MDCLYCRPWKSSRPSTLWALFTQEQAGIHLFSSRLTTYDLDVKHVWRYHEWFVKPNSSEKRFLSPRLGSCPQPPDDRWDPLTVADTRGGEGGRSTPNNFSWSLYSEKWNHKEVFILRKRSTMTTTNNQHNRTKWHCLKTNKKQYSKFLILWGACSQTPQVGSCLRHSPPNISWSVRHCPLTTQLSGFILSRCRFGICAA